MQPRPQAPALFPGLGGGAGKRRPGDEVEGHVQGFVTMKQTKFALRSLLLALSPSCRIVENLNKGSRKGTLRDSGPSSRSGCEGDSTIKENRKRREKFNQSQTSKARHNAHAIMIQRIFQNNN